MSTVIRVLIKEDGQGLAEYSLIIFGVIIGVVIAVNTFGGAINAIFGQIVALF